MKSIKNLLVPFIILVALCLFAAGYYIVENISNRNGVDNYESHITVYSCDSIEVSKLTVRNNETGSVCAVKCTPNGSGGVVCEYTGDDYVETEKYSQAKLLSFVNSLTNYYSEKKINGEGNYNQYGLDIPKYRVTIDALSGTVNVLLGNITPDGLYCYMCIEGSNDVYIVDLIKLSYADKRGIDFLESIKMKIDYREVKSVHFDRKTDGLSFDANVSVNNSGIASFELYSPYVHGASGYFGTMFDTLASIVIDDFVAIDISELKTYGLDVPSYHFVFNMNNGSKTEFFLSKPNSGYYYGYINGANKYFRLPENLLSGVDNAETVLIDPYICYCYVNDYTTIIGKYKDRTFKFELDVPAGSSITSEDSIVSLDGRNAKITDSAGRSYCSLLFESIACIKIGGVEVAEKAKPSSEAELTLTFIDKNYVTTVYEFYPMGTDSYYVFKNGEYMNFYVYATEIFNDGGSDTYNYGYWKAYELLNQAISENMNGIYDL